MPRPALASGICSVQRGKNPIARLIATIFKLPAAGDNQKITVNFSMSKSEPHTETWTRTIGKSIFVSDLSVGRDTDFLCEQIGLAKFYTALVHAPTAEVHLVLKRWQLFGIPMPMRLAPQVNAFEKDEAGTYQFFVEISHSIFGLIVRYQGSLAFRQEPSPKTAEHSTSSTLHS
jgi:Domain of unknown function (DUF4166)